MSRPLLTLPGIGNSGPAHWQTLWEAADPACRRIAQRDWEHPVCVEWVAGIEAAVRASGPETVIAAHSLGCLALAHWAAGAHAPIHAALLVAVPDAGGANFPRAALGFADTPTTPFDFRSIVVASDDDPYSPAATAGRLARQWGSEFVRIGRCGHINADSGLGAWPAGLALLEKLRG